MKNFIKLVCVVALLVVPVFSLTYRRETHSETNYSLSDAPRTLYLNNCARCHGADGRSDTELGRLNDAPDISGGKARRMGNAKLTRLITQGKGSMPGFGKKLTKAQITSIVSFVRGL